MLVVFLAENNLNQLSLWAQTISGKHKCSRLRAHLNWPPNKKVSPL